MTERRRPLDNDDGQESLFGGEAFAPAPGRTPAPWQGPGHAREDAGVTGASTGAEFEAGMTAPLGEAPGVEDAGVTGASTSAQFQAGMTAPLGEAQGAAEFGSGATVPLDDEQAAVDFEERDFGPSVEDLAAYAAFEAGVDAPHADAPAAPEMYAGAAPMEVPVHDAGDELEALERATVAADDVRRPRAPLAGPTLDNVMSRVWEGLVTGLPAACPVCHDEVVPSAHGWLRGRCSSCGTTID